MKTVLIAATFAAMSMSINAPVQAAPTAPFAVSLEQIMRGSFDRSGHRCDTPRDIAEHPRCSKA